MYFAETELTSSQNVSFSTPFTTNQFKADKVRAVKKIETNRKQDLLVSVLWIGKFSLKILKFVNNFCNRSHKGDRDNLKVKIKTVGMQLSNFVISSNVFAAFPSHF